MTSDCRCDYCGMVGWRAILGGLASTTGLTSLNNRKGFDKIRAGRAKALDLRRTELPIALAHLLPRSAATLTSLSIRRVDSATLPEPPDDAETGLLCEALSSLTALTRVDVSHNRHISGRLWQALVPLSRLTDVNSQFCHIDAAGASALAPALAGLTALRMLDLSSNEIDPAGASALAPSLSGLTAMVELDLSYNRLGDDGARVLLKEMAGLRRLDCIQEPARRICPQ
jgi:Leucine-rich repeat (LRR) protein